ncbi:MAG TPA: hypothetical protein VF771_06210 [Longimicrobiaceae bacterium]
MRARAIRPLLLALGLGGCFLPGRPGREVFTSEGVADASSFQCAQYAVRDLRYRLTSFDQGGKVLRAVRYLGHSDSDRLQGYLTVHVAPDSAERHRLLVSAERFVESTDSPSPAFPTPVPSPVPQPQPTPFPVPGRGPARVPRTRTYEPRRVSPGQVATDARLVVRRCAADGKETGRTE